jgi:hypothetical protein
LLILLFGPGGMTFDSFTHWTQGKTLNFDNWQPPLTALLMRVAQTLGAHSPWPILLAQGWLMGAGVFVFLRDSLRAPPLKIFALSLVVLLTPPVLLHAHMMWKDTWCAVAFVWTAISARRVYENPRSTTWLALGAAAISTAALRHNASLLIACLLAPLLVRSVVKRNVAQLATGLVIAMASLAVPKLLERLVSAHDLAPVQQILVHDLAGIETCNHFADWEQIAPNDVIPREALERGYRVEEVVPLFDTSRPYKVVNLYHAAAHVGAIAATWRVVVMNNLGCYFRHRLAVFQRLVGADAAPTCYPFEMNVGGNTYGIAAFDWWPRARALTKAMGHAVENTVLFRLWFYLASGFLLVVYFALRRDVALATFLGAAVTYQLAYVFIATTCDFRMGSALVIAVWLGAMVWAGGILTRRGASRVAS